MAGGRVRWSATALLIAAVAPSTASGRAATADERDRIGSYYLAEGGHILCTVRLSFEPSVGGEVQATGCATRAPAIDQAVRWWIDEPNGELVLEDAIHQVAARFAPDTHGTLVAYTARDQTLEVIDPAYLMHPEADVPGRWQLENANGDDPTRGCFVTFRRGGTLTVAPRCPASLRGWATGRWQATTHDLTVSVGAQRNVVERAADGESLFLPGNLTLAKLP